MPHDLATYGIDRTHCDVARIAGVRRRESGKRKHLRRVPNRDLSTERRFACRRPRGDDVTAQARGRWDPHDRGPAGSLRQIPALFRFPLCDATGGE